MQSPRWRRSQPKRFRHWRRVLPPAAIPLFAPDGGLWKRFAPCAVYRRAPESISCASSLKESRRADNWQFAKSGLHCAAVQDRVGKLTPLLSDVSAIAVICLLLFLEEAGLPLLFAPGEAVLLGAGLLISRGTGLAWVVIPLAYLSVLAGVAAGYWGGHRIGPKRRRSLARGLPAGGPYDRAAGRLRAATPLQIAGSRLLPGLRVYTSLVAGAVGLPRRRFVIGVLPASALWVIVFIGLGFFAGAPVEQLLGRFAAYGLRAGVLLVIAVIWVFVARRIPTPRREEEVSPSPARWRLPLALTLDFVLVFVVVAILS